LLNGAHAFPHFGLALGLGENNAPTSRKLLLGQEHILLLVQDKPKMKVSRNKQKKYQNKHFFLRKSVSKFKGSRESIILRCDAMRYTYHSLCKSWKDLRRSSFTLHDRPTFSAIRWRRLTGSRKASSGDDSNDRGVDEKDLLVFVVVAKA